MRVEIKNLEKTFGKTKAVDGVNFSFESGNIFGFVGPNGAGKTTTMRILATLDEPTSGDAYIDGVSCTEDPEKVRQRVGFVPDSLPTHTDTTVHEYLDFFARAYGLRGKERVRAVGSVEEFTGVKGISDKLLNALSKGMKQRVSLGRAMVHDPDVLIMDEPAAGLDPRARVELRELVSMLAEQQKAILISSHILTELTEICNGVVIIEKGQVLETGTIDDVIEKSSPKRLITIRAADKHDELYKGLLQAPGVENVRRAGVAFHVEIDGTEERGADLLAHLIQDGHRVVEFTQGRSDLEDIFMKITKGETQ